MHRPAYEELTSWNAGVSPRSNSAKSRNSFFIILSANLIAKRYACETAKGFLFAFLQQFAVRYTVRMYRPKYRDATKYRLCCELCIHFIETADKKTTRLSIMCVPV